MNICPVPPGPEHGECDCGNPTVLRWFNKQSWFVCDECFEYFRGKFNVVIRESKP